MHVINLGYLEDGPPCFTKLPDSGIEKLNRTLQGLDNAAAISNNDNKPSSNLSHLKAKWAKKKEKKTQRHQHRKTKLA